MEIKRKKAKIVSVRDYSVTTELNKKTVVITATQNLKLCKSFSGAKTVFSFTDFIDNGSGQYVATIYVCSEGATQDTLTDLTVPVTFILVD